MAATPESEVINCMQLFVSQYQMYKKEKITPLPLFDGKINRQHSK